MLKRLLILFLLSPAAMAAEQQDRDAGEPEPAAADTVPEDTAADDGAAGAESAPRMEQLPERFDPSEQLSEDLSTPFPVDI